MRVLIAGGGTGGHVIPALAVAQELKKRGAEVLFVGTARGLEARLVPQRGFRLELIEVGALKSVGAVRVLATLFQLPAAFVRAARIIEDFGPQVAYGVGGYASGPVLLMAALKNIPVVVHEANAVPGFANRLLAPWVTRALVAWEEALRYFPATRGELVGIPVNEGFFRIRRKARRPPGTILVTGGSQGAARLNRAVVEALPLFAAWPDPPSLIHQTGERELEAVKKAYAEKGVKGEVVAFLEDMPAAMARADLVVCRAGAATLAELAAAGKAALLAPFPYASDAHQLRNALSRRQAGAARVVEDHELDGPRLAREVEEMLGRLPAMEESARRLATPQALEKIVATLVRAGR